MNVELAIAWIWVQSKPRLWQAPYVSASSSHIAKPSQEHEECETAQLLLSKPSLPSPLSPLPMYDVLFVEPDFCVMTHICIPTGVGKQLNWSDYYSLPLQNSMYYWGFGAWMAYFINHPLYTPTSDEIFFPALIAFAVSSRLEKLDKTMLSWLH